MNNQNLTVLYEDSDFIAYNKPAGMIVNRADSAKGLTLQEVAEEKIKNEIEQAKKSSELYVVDGYSKKDEFISRGGVVHRLDKETSGIVLVAKKVSAFMNLQKQFKEKTVQKYYTALVHGEVEKQEHTISAPIGRLPWNRMRFGVLDGGREAVSDYKVLETFKWKGFVGDEMLTLVEVFPKTGRTHQIRVHFQHIKHPLFADVLYSGRKTARDDRKYLDRHFLHASKIIFKHPATENKMEIVAELPADLKQFLNQLVDSKSSSS